MGLDVNSRFKAAIHWTSTMNRELAIHLSKNAKRLPDSVKYKVANNIDPRVGQVIGYFQHILRHPIQG